MLADNHFSSRFLIKNRLNVPPVVGLTRTKESLSVELVLIIMVCSVITFKERLFFNRKSLNAFLHFFQEAVP